MPNRDFTYSEGCGCQVTFFAASEYHSSRMLPGEACVDHTGRFQVAERDCLVERAKDALDEYLCPRPEPTGQCVQCGCEIHPSERICGECACEEDLL